MRQDFVFRFLDKRIGTEFNFEKINGGTGFDLRNGNATGIPLNFLMVTSKTTNKKILTLASPSDTFWFDTNILEDYHMVYVVDCFGNKFYQVFNKKNLVEEL